MAATQFRQAVPHDATPAAPTEVVVAFAFLTGFAGTTAVVVALVTFAAVAALIDLAVGRIPNGIVLAVASAGAGRAVTMIVRNDATVLSVAGDAAMGVVLSGAAAMFLVWLVRPAAIGGGDWKLLASIGAVFGLLDVTAAVVVGLVAVAVQLVGSVVLRRRMLPFAPALACGTVVASAWLVVMPAAGWS